MLTNNTHYKNYLILLITCLLAYWPLTFGVFSVKNDALHYFLPYRFHISEAIRNGEFPFWSPYIYQGYPVYGDMQSGAWNPVVWLFSLFGRYDLTLFHWENLLYIFLSGAGMYKLAYRFTEHGKTALLAAICYMLSGFMLSGQLINWLAAGAFIPFVLYYYLQANSTGRWSFGIKAAISLYLLFVAGYPSFFILTIYLLFAMSIVQVVDIYRRRGTTWKNFWVNHFIIIVLFTGLALPAFISYTGLLPYYQRGMGTSFEEAIHNSYSVQHLVSLAFPSAIHATDLSTTTDVTCRNMYVGIFLLAVLVANPPVMNRRNMCLLLMMVAAFLFSLGDAVPLRRLTFDYLPLMDSFRHPSQARLFVIIGLILLALPGIRKLFEPATANSKRKVFVKVSVFTACIVLVTAIAAISSTLLSKGTPGGPGMASRFKMIIESMTLDDAVAINGIIQLVFLAFFLWWLINKNFRPGLLVAAWILNMAVMAQFALPLTFVSQTKPSEINKVIHSFPAGFPVEGLENSLEDNSANIEKYFEKLGSVLFYNKKPGISRLTNTPSFLVQMDSFLIDERLYRYVAGQPMVYFADAIVKESGLIPDNDSACRYVVTEPIPDVECDSNSNIKLYSAISSNSIRVNVKNTSAGVLVITQNYHPYWRGSDRKSPVRIFRANKAFLGVYLPPGQHNLHLIFSPPGSFILYLVPLVTLCVLVSVPLVRALLGRKRKTEQL